MSWGFLCLFFFLDFFHCSANLAETLLNVIVTLPFIFLLQPWHGPGPSPHFSFGVWFSLKYTRMGNERFGKMSARGPSFRRRYPRDGDDLMRKSLVKNWLLRWNIQRNILLGKFSISLKKKRKKKKREREKEGGKEQFPRIDRKKLYDVLKKHRNPDWILEINQCGFLFVYCCLLFILAKWFVFETRPCFRCIKWMKSIALGGGRGHRPIHEGLVIPAVGAPDHNVLTALLEVVGARGRADKGGDRKASSPSKKHILWGGQDEGGSTLRPCRNDNKPNSPWGGGYNKIEH